MAAPDLIDPGPHLHLAAETSGTYGSGLLDTLDLVAEHLRHLDPTDLHADELAEGLRRTRTVEGALTAAKARLIRAAEKADVAGADGATDMTAWVRDNLGQSGRQAKKDVDLGRGLERCPDTADALSKGEVGPEQAEQITRVANKGLLGMPREVEADLLESAKSSSPESLRDDIKRREARADADKLLKDELHARRRRSVRSWRRDDGLWEGRWLLDPTAGETVDAMIRAFTTPDPTDTPIELRRSPEQRRADALEQAATVALDAGAASDVGGEKPHVSVIVSAETLTCTGHDGDAEATCTCDAPAITTSGQLISRQALNRIVCDSQLSRIIANADGQVLDVGRATRTWSGSQRRAIVSMDGGCRFPGCTRPAAWSQIHHIRFWRNLGPTDLSNGVLLCTRHHHTVHDDGWHLTMDPATRTVTVTSPDGRRQLTSRPRGATVHRRRTG